MKWVVSGLVTIHPEPCSLLSYNTVSACETRSMSAMTNVTLCLVREQ